MKRIVVGVIIIMFGAFLLLNNLEVFPYSIYHLVISWQALLITIGAVFLFDRKSEHKQAGIFLIFIGALFLLPRIFDISLRGMIIPILIIALGIYCVVNAATKKNRMRLLEQKRLKHNRLNDFDEMPFDETSIDNEEIIKREYIFTGSKERWNYGVVKKVEVEAVFSGVELDFTQMELSEEVKTVHIKISSVFSGVTLYVPSKWNILIQKTGVFGGFTDRRLQSVIQSGKGKVVFLELEAVFGGGEIKCYE
ncbi:MAG: DUF5668 domain-containing protein [Candidatus Symbiothrix sp.]|jgi:predicted membrane protein|nr:DUF5668 domain-containing protein [Candidatus Symbiothrix sp.]